MRWVGSQQTAARSVRSIVRDLSPTAGAPLPPIRGVHSRWLAWLPQVLVALFAVVLSGVAGEQLNAANPDASVILAATLGLAQGLPLIVALYLPLAGFWTSIGIGMLVSEMVRAGGHGPVWTEPSLLIHLGVLLLVGLRARLLVLVVVWLLTLLAGAILVQRMPGLNASPDLVEMTTLSAIVLTAGGALRERSKALRRLADLERVSEVERLQRSLLEERARIARELHDVVAHHMSVIAIQAEAAPYRVPDAPTELTRSFGTIRTNALAALAELRRVLGLLRATESDGDADPQPNLARLDELLSNVRGAGLTVSARVDGAPRPLPSGVELSAYRIVQEALSNALRHAPGSDVCVHITYRAAALALRVVNGAPRAQPVPAGGPGHGLLGMRERAAMLSGELTAGPQPDGGYAVTAEFPVAATAPWQKGEA